MQPKTSNYNQPNNAKGKSRRLALLLITLVLLASVAFLNIQSIYDWIRLYDYSAPASISDIAGADQFTAAARRVFYVNHPNIETKDTFSGKCPNGGRESAVLGCYIPYQRGIYILQVNDPTLAGIEQVTGAHEMLHAEYDRLDGKTKNQIDSWLNDYYKHGLHDPNIIDQINAYKKSEPNDLVNEMHSLFGTEVRSLPANLETYYSQYFKNRNVVSSFYAAYENEFTSRIAQINQDDSELQNWKLQIDNLETDIHSKQASLLYTQQQLNAYRNSNNISAYNNGVPSYNLQVNSYNNEVQQVHMLVQQYNQLVSSRNAIALEEQQLVQDISSNTVTINN